MATSTYSMTYQQQQAMKNDFERAVLSDAAVRSTARPIMEAAQDLQLMAEMEKESKNKRRKLLLLQES